MKLLGSIISKTGGPAIDFGVNNGNVRGVLDMLVTSSPGVQTIIQLATKNALRFTGNGTAEVSASETALIDDVNLTTQAYDSFTNCVYKIGPHSSDVADLLHVTYANTFAQAESTPVFITLSWSTKPFGIQDLLTTPNVGNTVVTTTNNKFSSVYQSQADATTITAVPTIPSSDKPWFARVKGSADRSGITTSSTTARYTASLEQDVIAGATMYALLVARFTGTTDITTTWGPGISGTSLVVATFTEDNNEYKVIGIKASIDVNLASGDTLYSIAPNQGSIWGAGAQVTFIV